MEQLICPKCDTEISDIREIDYNSIYIQSIPLTCDKSYLEFYLEYRCEKCKTNLDVIIEGDSVEGKRHKKGAFFIIDVFNGCNINLKEIRIEKSWNQK